MLLQNNPLNSMILMAICSALVSNNFISACILFTCAHVNSSRLEIRPRDAVFFISFLKKGD